MGGSDPHTVPEASSHFAEDEIVYRPRPRKDPTSQSTKRPLSRLFGFGGGGHSSSASPASNAATANSNSNPTASYGSPPSSTLRPQSTQIHSEISLTGHGPSLDSSNDYNLNSLSFQDASGQSHHMSNHSQSTYFQSHNAKTYSQSTTSLAQTSIPRRISWFKKHTTLSQSFSGNSREDNNADSSSITDSFSSGISVSAIRNKAQLIHDDDGSTQVTGGKVFSVPLVSAVSASSLDPMLLLPAVVIRCIEFLDGTALCEVGLYRVPGCTKLVSNLLQVFDEGRDLNFFTIQPPIEPHAAAALLKRYLRDLPHHILGSAHEPFIKSYNSSNCQGIDPLPGMIAIATTMQPENYILMAWLCSHLARLTYFASVNLMSVSNIAVIFSPTLRIDVSLLALFISNSCAIFPLRDHSFEDAFLRKTKERIRAPLGIESGSSFSYSYGCSESLISDNAS